MQLMYQQAAEDEGEGLDHRVVYLDDDDTQGEAYYNSKNSEGSQPKLPWNTLSYGTKQLWIARMKRDKT